MFLNEEMQTPVFKVEQLEDKDYRTYTNMTYYYVTYFVTNGKLITQISWPKIL